jgi:hypothetical protein
MTANCATTAKGPPQASTKKDKVSATKHQIPSINVKSGQSIRGGAEAARNDRKLRNDR